MPHPSPTAARRRAFIARRVHPLTPDQRVLTDHAVVCREGRIEGLLPAAEVGAEIERVELGDVDLAPGFVDVQVNGGGGALFNDDPSVDTIRRIVAAHRRFGTTSLLPTFITDSIARMRAAREAVDTALAALEPGVLGVHFEGPWLDTRKTGAHDRAHVRAATAHDLELLTAPSEGVTLVTAAATRLGDGVLERLRSHGVLVSLGHCASTYSEARDAFRRGASGVTHLFNAMSPLESRAPGLVGAALATESVFAGLILDGVHSEFGAALAAYRALGPDRMMLVTDAVQPVGVELTEFRLGGMDVRLVDGRCVNEEGNLAGSALDMATAVRNAVHELGTGLDDALAMASRTPARFLGLEHEIGALAPGMRADLVVLGDGLQCSATVVGGELG